jgi:hypothetical protein
MCFSIKKLLKDVRKTCRWMTIWCNAGVTCTNMMGDLPGYEGEVWYNPCGIANILPLFNVIPYHKVPYGSTKEKSFFVYKDNGRERCF